jgi:hypothetical protein
LQPPPQKAGARTGYGIKEVIATKVRRCGAIAEGGAVMICPEESSGVKEEVDHGGRLSQRRAQPSLSNAIAYWN